MTDTLLEVDYHQTLNWEIWKKLLSKYVVPYRRLFIPLAVTTLITAMCDASFTLVTRHLIDDIVARGVEADFLVPGVLYFGLAIVLSSCVFAFILIAGRISTEVMYDLRKAGFFHLQKLSFSFYDKRSVGWLMARMTSDCTRLADTLAWGSLELGWSIPYLLGIAGVMIYMDWKIALLTFSVLPFLVWVSMIFKTKILRSSREVRKANSKITAAYNEGITGVITSKTLVREQDNLGEFGGLSAEMRLHSVQNALQTAAFFPVVLAFGSIATGIALWIGGVKVLAGVLTLGTLVAFVNYTGGFFEPILNLARIMSDMQTAQASAERIFDLLETEPEIQDSPEVLENIRIQQGNNSSGLAFDGGPDKIGSLAFKHTGFSYSEGTKILEDFNLNVPSGTSVALVGPTGGGKSTIVSLLCRFYEPTEGEILINGTDYRNRSLAWLQSNLGIVLQTPHLFSGSIRDNIQYADLAASEDQILEASKIANAHQFIQLMENGYESEVGELGNNLSTGQKQLVSLARAVLADPQIFIMDEATSSVDPETEQLIQAGLARVLADRTSFIIAHRLSTIRSADMILLIEEGRISEQGNHQELIRKKGKYYDLYTKQFLQEKEVEAMQRMT